MGNDPRVPEMHAAPPATWIEAGAVRYLPDATGDEAYWQGAWAFSFGRDDDANPYPTGHPCREMWQNGWSDSAEDNGG